MNYTIPKSSKILSKEETFNLKSHYALHSGWLAKFRVLGPLLRLHRFLGFLICLFVVYWAVFVLTHEFVHFWFFSLFSSLALVQSGVNIGKAVGCWAASWSQCTTTKDLFSFLTAKSFIYAYQCCKFKNKLINYFLISIAIKKKTKKTPTMKQLSISGNFVKSKKMFCFRGQPLLLQCCMPGRDHGGLCWGWVHVGKHTAGTKGWGPVWGWYSLCWCVWIVSEVSVMPARCWGGRLPALNFQGTPAELSDIAATSQLLVLWENLLAAHCNMKWKHSELNLLLLQKKLHLFLGANCIYHEKL